MKQNICSIITALALVAMMGCDRSAEEPPPSGGTQTAPAEPECTLDTLESRDQKNLASYKGWNTKARAKDQAWTQEIKDHFKAATALPSVPSKINPPPQLQANSGNAVDNFQAVVDKKGKCRLETDSVKVSTMPIRSWKATAILAALGFKDNQETPDDEADWKTRYVRQVDFFNDEFAPYTGSAWSHSENKSNTKLRNALVAITQDEDQLKLFMPWAIRAMPVLVRLHTLDESEAKQWVKDLYKASKANMASLQRAVEDQTEDEYTGGPTGDRYLYRNKKKLAGLFLRRWMTIRGAARGAASREDAKQHADEMILVYRFWLTQVAKELGMKTYARRWGKKLAKKMRKAKTLKHRDWYMKQL